MAAGFASLYPPYNGFQAGSELACTPVLPRGVQRGLNEAMSQPFRTCPKYTARSAEAASAPKPSIRTALFKSKRK